MSAQSTERLIGEYGARLDSMDARLTKIEEQIELLVQFTLKVKGGWAVVLLVAGLAGFVANFISNKLFGRGS